MPRTSAFAQLKEQDKPQHIANKLQNGYNFTTQERRWYHLHLDKVHAIVPDIPRPTVAVSKQSHRKGSIKEIHSNHAKMEPARQFAQASLKQNEVLSVDVVGNDTTGYTFTVNRSGVPYQLLHVRPDNSVVRQPLKR